MKYCSKCGKEIMDEAVICPGCGCAQENNVQGNSVPQIKEALSDIQKEAWSNSGWLLLGFFIPIVGLILYLVWKETSPSKAKAAGYGALIGFVISLCGGLIAGIFALISVL
jgi:uncharacterized membrane protein YvbJ